METLKKYNAKNKLYSLATRQPYPLNVSLIHLALRESSTVKVRGLGYLIAEGFQRAATQHG